jgi:hypothetical protein
VIEAAAGARRDLACNRLSPSEAAGGEGDGKNRTWIYDLELNPAIAGLSSSPIIEVNYDTSSLNGMSYSGDSRKPERPHG